MRPGWLARLGPFLVVLLAAASPGAAAGDGRVVPVDDLVVVDSTGQEIGPLVGNLAGLIGLVRFRAQDRSLLLGVGRDTFLGLLRLSFESVDCTGPAFTDIIRLPGVQATLLDPVALDPSTGDLVVAGDFPETRTIRSTREALTPGGPCELVDPPRELTLGAVVVVGTVAGFTAPFGFR